MNFLQLIPLTAAVVNLLLSLFVFSRSPRSKLNQIYLLWGFSISLWNFGTFFMFRVQTREEALLCARLIQFGVIFLPIYLFHLCLMIAQIPAYRALKLLYALMALFAITNFTPYFVADVRYAENLRAWYTVGGIAFWIYTTVYIILTVVTILVLVRRQRTLPPLHKMRLKSLLLATGVLFFFGSNDILPILGIYKYPFTNLNIFPYGSAAAIFYGIIVGYSVLQHQLLDVHVTLSRLAAQFVRLLFMFLIGFSLLLILALIAPGEFTVFSFYAAVGVLLGSALAASFFFPQFFGKASDALERQILGDRFEYHARVQNMIHTMRSFPEPQYLLEELEDLMVNTVKIRSYQIILLDENTRGFSLFYSHPPQPQTQFAELHIDSPLFRYFQQSRATFFHCKSPQDTVRETKLVREARDQLKQLNPDLCFPLFSGQEVVGMMLLGGKVNGDIFTPHDLRLLIELAHNLGLLLNQIRLRNQLQVAHEQDLLGRMSRGLAHDLNNLLTPVQTLLQLFEASTPRRDAIDDLLPMALRNIDTVRSYVNEALFFSRDATLTARPGSLDETIREAIQLIQPSAGKKQVVIEAEGLPPASIEMDSVLIKRLICNLLSNAVDASPAASRILVRLVQLPKTEISRDWHRVQIIDVGEGISAENLKRVFTPYFTTKNTGDGKRGFGLGLAIARKIVHLHGGNLTIASKEKSGTTVQVDFPSRQTKNLNSKSVGDLIEAVPA